MNIKSLEKTIRSIIKEAVSDAEKEKLYKDVSGVLDKLQQELPTLPTGKSQDEKQHVIDTITTLSKLVFGDPVEPVNNKITYPNGQTWFQNEPL